MASVKRERVAINRLGTAMHNAISELAKRSPEVVGKAVVREWPLKFERAAKAFYPESPLRRISSNLFRSIKGFSQRTSPTRIISGLRDKMDYARHLEFGTKHIKARKFLSTPLRSEADKLIEKLLKDIGW